MSVDVVAIRQNKLHVGHSPGEFLGDLLEARGPCSAFDRHTLSHRSALRKHALELWIAPAGREIDVVVAVKIRVNEPGEADEGQIQPVDRMRAKQRISGRQLDRPETVEL